MKERGDGHEERKAKLEYATRDALGPQIESEGDSSEDEVEDKVLHAQIGAAPVIGSGGVEVQEVNLARALGGYRFPSSNHHLDGRQVVANDHPTEDGNNQEAMRTVLPTFNQEHLEAEGLPLPTEATEQVDVNNTVGGYLVELDVNVPRDNIGVVARGGGSGGAIE